MVKSDTTNRYLGLLQLCEDKCGLGATGITSSTALYSQFVGWLNQWNKTAASYAIMSWDGADFDDKAYTTLPYGRITGTTNRDYNIDSAYKMLKLKSVSPCYDGTNIFRATPMDMEDKLDLAKKDPNIDSNFSVSAPQYDERANGFELYPKFTAAQVALGAFIDVEWFRTPRDFDTTGGTDAYEPALDLQFHHFVAVGASWEYCKLYKPDMAPALASDIYGYHGRYGASIPGMLEEIKNWYNSKSPSNVNLTVKRNLKV